jgi:hypothetical protein
LSEMAWFRQLTSGLSAIHWESIRRPPNDPRTGMPLRRTLQFLSALWSGSAVSKVRRFVVSIS